MVDKDMGLGDAMIEIMDLSKKYNFTTKDKFMLLDRCMLFAEAITLLTDLGLYDELVENYQKAVIRTAKVVKEHE